MFPCRRTEPPFFRRNRRRFFPELSIDEKESSSENACQVADFFSVVVVSVKKSNRAENQLFSSSSSNVVDPEKHVTDCQEVVSLFEEELKSGEWYFLWKLDHVSSSTIFLLDISWISSKAINSLQFNRRSTWSCFAESKGRVCHQQQLGNLYTGRRLLWIHNFSECERHVYPITHDSSFYGNSQIGVYGKTNFHFRCARTSSS